MPGLQTGQCEQDTAGPRERGCGAHTPEHARSGFLHASSALCCEVKTGFSLSVQYLRAATTRSALIFTTTVKKKRLLADPGTGYPSVTVPGVRKLIFDRGREVLLSRDAQRARLRIREVVRAHIL